MLVTGCPAFVVDTAVDEHLKVLGLMLVGSTRIVEGVKHADALNRLLLYAVHKNRLRQTGGLQHRGCDVNHVMKLAADFTLSLDSLGPVNDCTLAGAAPV